LHLPSDQARARRHSDRRRHTCKSHAHIIRRAPPRCERYDEDLPSPAISVHGLRKVYETKAAVDGLTLEVPRGSFFGFLGPNGAGKSTTIRMLTGLAPPSAGTIEILGYRMPQDELEIKKRIGLVPDESLLFDRLTGFEYLDFVGRMYALDRKLARERALELLDLFELTGEPKKMIADYSKGMRKRVAMAAALIHRPELFLMDEPFEGVDAVGARLMKDILQDQVRQGATVFLTTHMLEVVERLCDHVAIISDGRIIRQGPMEELRAAGESLEEAFVRIVGVKREAGRLDWLL
jgi:ABC-2 type transport system ATP-binding protein